MTEEQQNQDQIAEQQEKVNQLIKDYKITFDTENGQKVFADLQTRFHVLSSTNVKGDSHESAFMEGQRSVVLTIINLMNRKI